MNYTMLYIHDFYFPKKSVYIQLFHIPTFSDERRQNFIKVVKIRTSQNLVTEQFEQKKKIEGTGAIELNI